MPKVPDQLRIRRIKENAVYDRQSIYRILDEGLVCHVGFVDDGQPVVIPMLYARRDDSLLLHGAVASRLQKVLAAGARICVTITLLDGLVLARSAFNHSVNYRSVVAFGIADKIKGPQAKRTALDTLVDKLVPGRRADIRDNTRQELAATSILEFPLDEIVAKVRTGPPDDFDKDMKLPIWAGVLPVTQQFGEPVPDPALVGGSTVPDYVRKYRRSGGN
ncbi:MAG: pyridoxamine 5'-phosphate oxidase family protein [Gammaproteobacteria bacterium]